MYGLNTRNNFMQRYFIRLSFDGKPFHGWQVQKNSNSIQAELNKALCILLKRDQIETVGCGRTDTGVHAKKFYAHFDTNTIADTETIVHQLNSILPHQITVQSIFPVDKNAHARYDAISRTYTYRMYFQRNPFLREWAYYYPNPVDAARMNIFANKLKDYSDFSSFSKSNTQTLTNICIITFAEWKQEGDELVFTITADRFLRNMVRAIVGTLLKAGVDKLSENDFAVILKSKNRSEAGFSVPAHGLYLTDIVYPFSVI